MEGEEYLQKQDNPMQQQGESEGGLPLSDAPRGKVEKNLHNTGEFFLRQRILQRWLEDLEERIGEERDYTLFQRYIGERDGIFETMGLTHEKVVEKMVESKKVLAGLEDTGEAESEYSDFEKPYIEGYINGIAQTLRAGRRLLENPFPSPLSLSQRLMS